MVIKGANVMRGYLNRPEETAKTLVDGWLHTGDIGRFDEDGYLVLVDRAKDMIIRGGENIYPKEIETVVHQLPQIAEAAVVGRAAPGLRRGAGAVRLHAPGRDRHRRRHSRSHRRAAREIQTARWRSRFSTTCPRTPSARSTSPTLRSARSADSPRRPQPTEHEELIMGFTKPELPAVDPEAFLAKPFMERMRFLTQHWVENGFGVARWCTRSTSSSSCSSTRSAASSSPP